MLQALHEEGPEADHDQNCSRQKSHDRLEVGCGHSLEI